MRLGVFFSPGAARGAYQAGVAYGLVHDAGLRFEVVSGSSVGALNGAFVASGKVDELVEFWSRARTRDILAVDWRALARGAVFWSRNLLSNGPQRRNVIEPYLSRADLPDDVRLRVNLDDLDSLSQAFFEWPGAALRMPDGVHACMAMVGMIRPYEALGKDWCDGGVLCGNPLEEIALSTGIERLFVVGVAPRGPIPTTCTSPLSVIQRTAEWSQFSETLLNIERAEEVNQLVVAWNRCRDAAVAAGVADQFDAIPFPYTRPPVDIVPILPEESIDMMFIDYQPERSARLIDLGRRDALRALARIDSTDPDGLLDEPADDRLSGLESP